MPNTDQARGWIDRDLSMAKHFIHLKIVGLYESIRSPQDMASGTSMDMYGYIRRMEEHHPYSGARSRTAPGECVSCGSDGTITQCERICFATHADGDKPAFIRHSHLSSRCSESTSGA